MTPFSDEQVLALAALTALWGDRFSLIGASALGCQFDTSWRATQDIDITLALSAKAVDAQLSRLPGWRRDAHLEQRWIAPGGVKIDVIPEATTQTDTMIWPETGAVMSTVGLRLATEHRVAVTPGPGLVVYAASVPVIVLLKMVAYLDRPAERERDLEDLANVLTEYPPIDDPRRFADPIHDHSLSFDEAGPFVLGQELGAMTNGRERKAAREFLDKARNENDSHATAIRMARLGPLRWREDEDALRRILQAFELGLQSAGLSPSPAPP